MHAHMSHSIHMLSIQIDTKSHSLSFQQHQIVLVSNQTKFFIMLRTVIIYSRVRWDRMGENALKVRQTEGYSEGTLEKQTNSLKIFQ